MKKITLSFVAVSVGLSFYSVNTYANNLNSTTNQCLIDVPKFNQPLVQDNFSALPVEIQSDDFQAVVPNKAIYQGNVLITQGNRSVHSDKVTINQSDNNQKKVTLNGDIIYLDNLVKMTGDDATINLNNNDVEIENSRYHLVDRLGRGSASKMQFLDNRYIILNNGSFTSCPVDNSSWNIEGSKIIYDEDEQLLKVWNAVFKIAKIPVLYTPYLQLPTGNKRRSGLLIPSISFDSIAGTDISLPIYWNIAHNYDATFTPRFMQRRGLQIQTEMRYLNELGLGTLAFDWLQHDALYKKENNSTEYGDNKHRWLFHWKNAELINYNWRVKIDATRVSDNQYLTDIGSKYASETDGYLTQHYQVGYADENWDMDLNYKYFQSLRSNLKDSLYYTEPQFNLNYYNKIHGFSLNNYLQISHFVNAANSDYHTWRYHIEPTVGYTLVSPWASFQVDAGLMATHYRQDMPVAYQIQANNYKDNVTRVLPRVSVDSKMIFQRDVNSIDGYTQTLEPRIKYMYIPYRNQSNTLNYDSSLLQFDYVELFRDRVYSGLDRVASSNKVTTGITTRFYDGNKIERFNFSLGQIYYFTPSRTGDTNTSIDSKNETGSITWATDAYWLISDNTIFRGGMQYDSRINEVSLANLIAEYRVSEQKLVQLSYRYANKNYIDNIDLPSSIPYKQDISQLGIISSWPISENVSVVGAYFYDVNLKQTVNNYVGVNYADCCWGVSLQYGRKITDWNNNSKQSEYENKFSINFELRGFGRNNNASAKMLNFGLLPYKTAFE